MTILIVDDDAKDRALVSKKITEWGNKNKIDVNIKEMDHVACSSPAMRSIQDVDVLILDVEMPGIDGMTLAQHIREQNSRIEIIFVSSHAEFALRGYNVRAADYLCKPVQNAKLYAVLDYIQKRLTYKDDEPVISLKRGTGVDKYYCADILYIKARLHGIEVVTIEKRQEYNISIGDVQKILPEKVFSRCHRSYIVNTKKVTEIESKLHFKLHLVSGETLDIGRAYFENIKTAAEYLEKTTGNILITTGSKEIAKFSVVADRALARVQPSEESLELCKNAGIKMKNIICMQGPFSKAFNSALIRELDIKYLVTKCTGKNGGFTEKTEAAKENGVECIIIKRPTDESGMTDSEVEKMILEWL